MTTRCAGRLTPSARVEVEHSTWARGGEKGGRQVGWRELMVPTAGPPPGIR